MKLYEYQQIGVEWLKARRRAYLGDAPGLGKTPQLIRAAGLVGIEQPVVLCPAIARTMWGRQWARWGLGKPLVFSYDELVAGRNVPEHDLLILDEVQACRNMEAQRTKLALTLANRAERVWLASGTPVPNHVGNLYPVLRAVWPDELRKLGITNYTSFLNFFATYITTVYGIKITGTRNVPVMRELLGRIMLRRTESDEIDLPPLRWDEFFLPPMRLADEVVEAGEEAAAWGDDIPQDAHLATARRLLGIEKATVVGELLKQELEDGAYTSLVVGTMHIDVAAYLSTLLGGVCITGATSQSERDRRINVFQSGEAKVMVAQIQTAGTAVDLFTAHEVALVEQSWSPSDNLQFIKRVHRIGQTASVRARMFFADTDLDLAVARILKLKLRLVGEIVHE